MADIQKNLVTISAPDKGLLLFDLRKPKECIFDNFKKDSIVEGMSKV
jgi:hypothetical protein